MRDRRIPRSAWHAVIAVLLLTAAMHARAVEWERVTAGAPQGQVGTVLDGPLVLGDGTVVFVVMSEATFPAVRTVMGWSSEAGLAELHTLTGLFPSDAPLVALAPGGEYQIGGGSDRWFSLQQPASALACPVAAYGELTIRFDSNGTAEAIDMAGAPVPGADEGWIFGATPLFSFYYFAPPAVNATGDLAYATQIRMGDPCAENPMTPHATGMLGPDGAGGITLIAAEGEPAPGAPTGATLRLSGSPILGDTGDVAFQATVRIGATGPNVAALYRWKAGADLELVALEGFPHPLEGLLRVPSKPILGSSGHIVFLDGSDSTNPPRTILIHDPVGSLRVAVGAGSAAPGVDGYVFDSFYDFDSGLPVAVDAQGHVGFHATVKATTGFGVKSGIWAPSPSGDSTLRLLSGDPAPGFPTHTIQRVSLLGMNDRGDALIKASAFGTASGIVSGFNAYYLSRASGEVELLVRDGDSFEVEPGNPVPIEIRSVTANPTLTRVALATQSASSALFSATLPEPDGLVAALVAGGALYWLSRRRRRRPMAGLSIVGLMLFDAQVTLAREWSVLRHEPPWSGSIDSLAWQPDGSLWFSTQRLYSTCSLFRWSGEAGSELLFTSSAGTVIGDPPMIVASEYGQIAVRRGHAVVSQGVLDQACPGEGGIAHSFVGHAAELDVLVQPGIEAPGFDPGWMYYGHFGNVSRFALVEHPIGAPLTNDLGESAFLAWVVQRDDRCSPSPLDPYVLALYAPDGAGGHVVAAMDEQQAPGYPEGAVLLPTTIHALNQSGDVLFAALVRLGPSGPFASGLFRHRPGEGLRRMVGSEDELPGADYLDLSETPILREDGSAMGLASLADAGTLVWIADDSGVETVLAVGDPAPAHEPEWTFRSFAGVESNANGDLSITATAGPTAGETRVGVWATNESGSLMLRSLGGDPAPGVPGSSIGFLTPWLSSTPIPPVMLLLENRDLILILRVITGSDPFGKAALYVSRASGELELLMPPDLELDYEGTSRFLSPVAFAYDAASTRIAVHADSGPGGAFPDTTALLVSTIPEPGAVGSAVVLLALALLRLSRFRSTSTA